MSMMVRRAGRGGMEPRRRCAGRLGDDRAPSARRLARARRGLGLRAVRGGPAVRVLPEARPAEQRQVRAVVAAGDAAAAGGR